MSAAPVSQPVPWRRLGGAGRGALAALLLLGAGCAQKLRFSEGSLTANASRTTLVYVQEQELVRRRGDVEQRIPLERLGCLKREELAAAELFYVFPAGDRALVYATPGNLPGFNVFGHEDRHASTGCLLDLEQGAASPLEQRLPPESYLLHTRRNRPRVHVGATTGRLHVWDENSDFDPLEVVELGSGQRVTLPLPPGRRPCDVVETREELLVACAPSSSGPPGEGVLIRYGLDAWPPPERSRSRLELDTTHWTFSLTLSPDGRHLVSIGSGENIGDPLKYLLSIRELATGRRVLLFPGLESATAATVEFIPDGSGLLVGDSIRSESYIPIINGLVRHYTLDGTWLQSWDLPEGVRALIAPPGSTGFWAVLSGEARWIPWKSARRRR
jgi:hypothetical protein